MEIDLKLENPEEVSKKKFIKSYAKHGDITNCWKLYK